MSGVNFVLLEGAIINSKHIVNVALEERVYVNSHPVCDTIDDPLFPSCVALALEYSKKIHSISLKELIYSLYYCVSVSKLKAELYPESTQVNCTTLSQLETFITGEEYGIREYLETLECILFELYIEEDGKVWAKHIEEKQSDGRLKDLRALCVEILQKYS